MQPRAVSAAHGWTWITRGHALFRKSPMAWAALLLLLFFSANLLLRIPVLGIVFVLLTPLFFVGLMEGCRALENGEPLLPKHLLSGFGRNAAHLVTLGGVTLIGNFALMMVVLKLGGEPLAAQISAVQEGAALAPQAHAEAAESVREALLLGLALSLPLFMALWYAPLLVHFDGQPPLAAMRSSFVGCLRNAAPLLVYGGLVILGMCLALMVMMVLRQMGLPLPYDLALWVLTPVVVPSIYASYSDIFRADVAAQTAAAPPLPPST